MKNFVQQGRRMVKSILSAVACQFRFVEPWENQRHQIRSGERRLYVVGHHLPVGDFSLALRQGISPYQMISGKRFEEQIKWLLRDFEPVTLQEGLRYLEGGPLRHKSPVVLTFDDGYRTVYEIAYPILKRHGVPATLFVCTDYVGTDRLFIHDRLFHLLWRGHRIGLSLERFLPRGIETSRGQRPQPMTRFLLERLAEAEVLALIGRLEEVLSVLPPDYPDLLRVLTWEELHEMDRGGVTVGAHTKGHRILTRHPADRIQEELSESKRVLERNLGREVAHVAYPNGAWDPEVVRIAKSAGYQSGITTQGGPNGSAADLLTLKRTVLCEWATRGGGRNHSDHVGTCLVKGLFL